MKKLHTVLFALITVLLFTPIAQASNLDDVKFFVDTYYYGDIPHNLQTMETVDEIINALDEYSRYLTADEYTTYSAAIATTESPAFIEKHIITSTILYGNIGYIQIPTFSSNLAKEVEVHWARLKKSGVTQLIIDLRYNGGGYVESAEQLLGFFPGVTTAYEVASREGTAIIKPNPASIQFPTQTYVLVNRYSASASEMLAVSVKDQQAAILVGETTKGKGTIQAFFEMQDGDALKLTIGEFTGPKGTVVHKKGVTPNINTKPRKELTTIHQRLLHESLTKRNYKQTKSLLNVPTNKTFHIQFTQSMNFIDVETSRKIELIKYGGTSIPITIKQSTANTLEISPNKQLQPGASYILVIHPGHQNANGRTTKQGSFTHITVQDDQ